MRFAINQNQTGFTLLEVLVTLVVVGLGMLGQGVLLAQSSKSTNAAFNRSQATFLADDFFERLRMNEKLAEAGQFNITSPNTVPNSATAIALYEMNDWINKVVTLLPGGQATVSVDASGNATIVISWTELAKGADAQGNVQLTTFTTQSVI